MTSLKGNLAAWENNTSLGNLYVMIIPDFSYETSYTLVPCLQVLNFGINKFRKFHKFDQNSNFVPLK